MVFQKVAKCNHLSIAPSSTVPEGFIKILFNFSGYFASRQVIVKGIRDVGLYWFIIKHLIFRHKQLFFSYF